MNSTEHPSVFKLIATIGGMTLVLCVAAVLSSFMERHPYTSFEQFNPLSGYGHGGALAGCGNIHPPMVCCTGLYVQP